MKKSASFTGFDSSVWITYDGHTNPLLRTFLTPLSVSYTVSGSKTYDGTTDGGTISSVATTGTLTSGKKLLGTATAVLSSKDAGTVTATGSGLYSEQQGYLITASTTGPGTVTITPKALSASLAAQTKTYDGNTTATLAPGAITASGFAPGEGASVTQTSGTYSNKNVEGATSVTATLTSTDFSFNDRVLASNYALPTSVTGTGSITPKALSATASASNKVYDGNTTAAATLAITAGLVGQETVTPTGAATFNSKDVTEANLVTINSTALANGDNGGRASNYSLAAGQIAAASISKANLTQVTADKTYDGLSTVNAAEIRTIAGVYGESFTASSGTAAISDKNVLTANKTITDLSGLALGSVNGSSTSNYNLDSASLPAAGTNNAVTITPKALSANLAAQTKTYDGNTTATWTSGAITASGFANGEGASVTQTSGAYNDKNVVGATSVTATLTSSHFIFNNGVIASNYALPTSVTGTGSITPKALSATASASNKVYDGNTTAVATLVIDTAGFVDTERVTATGTATFNSKNVLDANLVTVNSTALANGDNGGLASNYSLAAGQFAAASITPKALSATASASNKVYDGDTTAAATLAIDTAGFVGTERVTATGAATFNSKDVTGANLVTINSTALANGDNGGLASNYSLAAGQTAAATITKATLTYTANPASSNTGNAPTGLSGTVSGFVKDENQNTATTGNLEWTTPATSASSPGSYAINGTGLNANNYSFSQAAGNSTALTLTMAQTTSIEPVVIATPQPSNTSLPKIEQAAQNTPPLVSQAAGNSAGNSAVNSSGNSAASTLTQADSRVQTTSFVPVITPPSLFSNTSFARSAQLAQNTQPFSDSFDVNSLSPAGAGTEEETTEKTQENGEENASRPTGSTGMLNTKATGL